jgi:hypothetical protein
MHLEKWNRKASRSKIMNIPVIIHDTMVDLKYKDGQVMMGVRSVVYTSLVHYGIAHHEGLRHHLHDDFVIRFRHPNGAT